MPLMTRHTATHILTSIVLVLLIAIAPTGVVWALTLEEDEPAAGPQVFITEIQTGLGTGQTDKEYIELYNAGNEPVDISDWQLWYAPESRTAPEPYRTVTFEDGDVIAPLQHLIIASEGYLPNQVVPTAVFEKMLAADGGNVALLAPATGVCQLRAQDAVSWGNGLLGAGISIAHTPKTKDTLFTRVLSEELLYQNTRQNGHDFRASTFAGSVSSTPYLGTPGSINSTSMPRTPDPTQPPRLGLDFALPILDPSCEPPSQEEPPVQQPPQTVPPSIEPPSSVLPSLPPAAQAPKGPVFPARSKGLAAPHITELLPNPASPQTDANDEFVELYNSNEAVFELSGFKITSGKRSYTFPQGTLIEPQSFAAYFSADTKLALSNSGGHVQLLDPFGNILTQTGLYGTAKSGQSWALTNGAWQWTVLPTPNSENAIQAPSATARKKKTTNTNKSIATTQLTSKKAAGEVPTAANPAQQIASTVAQTPIHPGILVLVGVCAILYGIYEYRGDLANKFYQLRTNRAARRSLRQTSEGQ